MKSTTDIWFVAFLLNIKNTPVHHWLPKGRGRAVFFFGITEDEWTDAKREFNSDEKICSYSTIKYQLERIKDLIH